MTGIELLKEIQNGDVKEGTRIKVYENIFSEHEEDDLVTELFYKNGDLKWEPGSFRAKMLYDEDYEFVLTDKKLDNIKLNKNLDINLSLKEEDENWDKIELTLNKIITYINENK